MSYEPFEDLLICPECHSRLKKENVGFICINSDSCGCSYPVYFNVPVIVSSKNLVFTPADFSSSEPPDIFFKKYKCPLIRFFKKIRPDVTLNYISKKNYKFIAESLQGIQKCKILVIGGSIDGSGISELKHNLPEGTILVESDVAHGPNTNIIFDSHQIPFENDAFDLVIIQAVLEHVLDPFKCVAEINRVLKNGGQVYAETPFMQQVHGGKYDFHRFTYLGHRRLFRYFKETKSGIVAGPGSSLAWSIRYFITSFATSKKIDTFLSYGANFLAFWVKYFDYFLNRNEGSIDAACGLYFLGKKENGYVLPDEELLKQYRGLRY